MSASKKRRTLDSFFSKISRTSSVGSDPKKSCSSDSVTGKELGSQSAVKEFDTQSQVTVVQDAPAEGTRPGVGRTVTQANAAGSDRYAIGRAVQETKRGEQLTDNEREAYLSER